LFSGLVLRAGFGRHLPTSLFELAYRW
jgi:hypothetical protein